MTKRYDVLAPRAKKDGGTFWHRVGTAFENDKGIGVVFDSLPLPDAEGRVSVRLFEPRAKDKTEKQEAAEPQGRRASMKDALDDEIPFAPEFR